MTILRQTSVVGIEVRKRKYADTPLHQSVCLRRYTDRCVYKCLQYVYGAL